MWRKTPDSLPTEAPTHSLISFEPQDASIKACRLAKQHGSDDQDRATAHNLQDAAFSGGTTVALLASPCRSVPIACATPAKHKARIPCKPRCSIPIVCSARKVADTAAFSAIVYHVLAKKAPVGMQIGSLSVQNQLKPSDFPFKHRFLPILISSP